MNDEGELYKKKYMFKKALLRDTYLLTSLYSMVVFRGFDWIFNLILHTYIVFKWEEVGIYYLKSHGSNSPLWIGSLVFVRE